MKLSENHTTILSTYTQWLQMLGFSASIVYGYPKMVSHFLVWLQQNGIFGITQLNTNHLHHYYTYLENRPNQKVAGRGLSAAHLNKNFDAVDKLCECLHHMGMDQAPSPTQYRLAYKYSERPSVLTQQEVRDLYGAIPHTFAHHGLAAREPRQAILHLVLDLLYGCGLRRSEVTKLTLSDVDLDRKILHVRQAKGYKDRYVPLSKGVYRSIQLFVYQYRAYWSRRERHALSLHQTLPALLPGYFAAGYRQPAPKTKEGDPSYLAPQCGHPSFARGHEHRGYCPFFRSRYAGKHSDLYPLCP